MNRTAGNQTGETAPQTVPTDQQPSDPLAGIVQWDVGTAYDFLLSVHTILAPKDHGVPAPWAAGVRKRLSAQSQRDLKDFYAPTYSFRTYTPLHLVLQMDSPKDAAHLLSFVEAIPDQDFARKIHVPHVSDPALARITNKVLNGAKFTSGDVEEYRRGIARTRLATPPTVNEVRRLFAEMANPAETKRRWLSLMREYLAVFFAEEEQRERAVLEHMLAEAQELARTRPISEVVERASHGFTFSEDADLKRIVLAPSIWFHPFVVRIELAERELLVAWGAHPPGYRLVPGESVPDTALLVLRALGDPTRLRLLRLIAAEPRSLQSLAQEVKLSLPTVSHHIRELRGAGLIRLELGGGGRESKYTVRWPSAQQAFHELEEFVLRET